MNMEAESSSETKFFFQTARRYDLEERPLHSNNLRVNIDNGCLRRECRRECLYVRGSNSEMERTA
jgi:hypothetical protein